MLLKRTAIFILILVTTFSSVLFGVSAPDPIRLLINGDLMIGENQPLLVDNRTLAPIRLVAEQLGAEVQWIGEHQVVMISQGLTQVSLQINNNLVIYNNEVREIDVPPQIINSRTYVPLRFISDVLGYDIGWDSAERQVTVNSKSAFTIQTMMDGLINNHQAILLEMEGEASYHIMQLVNPDRYVIDFHDTKFNSLVTSVASESTYFSTARASQFSNDPLTARVVLDLLQPDCDIHIEDQQNGYIAIYGSGGSVDPVDLVDPVDPEDPTDPIEIDPALGLTTDRASLQININPQTEYTVESVTGEDQEEIFGVISSEKVNLRDEPSTADPNTVVVTIDGGTVLQVVGQTNGWYQVVYRGSRLWVADWLLTLDLEMKRDNVNVRSGPGLQYDPIDMIMRGEAFKVTERLSDWLKVITPQGKEGYVADWLVGINDRLVDGVEVGDDVAHEIILTLKNTQLSQFELGIAPTFVEEVNVTPSGTSSIVHLKLSETVAYQIVPNENGLEVIFGAALLAVNTEVSASRVKLILTFDQPVKYTVYQHYLENSLLLDFPFSQAVVEGLTTMNGNIIKTIETSNRADSAQVFLQLDSLGSYKINTTEFSRHIEITLLSTSLSGKIIALDPGHGGSDPGATYAGIEEADINLAVAKMIEELLIERGVTVIMTRNGDQSVSLGERVSLINSMDADIAISIHVNSVASGTGSGVETIYYPRAENERLASVLQDALVLATGFRSRGIKPWSNIYVTQNTKMPSALVEMGFITNAEERGFLTSLAGKQALAENIVMAIERFFIDN